MAENNSSSRSVGFCSLLTVLFVGLKLTHYIAWSWLWVLAPLWISAVFGITVLILLAIIAIAVKY